jgi:uncharacterized protein (TIGR02391 family)
MGEASKNEAVKILYLAASPGFSSTLEGAVADYPVGRSLARNLSTEHVLRVRGAIFRPNSPVFRRKQVPSSIMSADELDEFDAVYMEDGWNRSYDDPVRFPLNLAESYVRRGGQLIVADASWPKATSMQETLREADELFNASFRFHKVRGKEGVCYLYDDDQKESYGTRYFTSQMAYVDDWLKPALEGIDSILANSAADLYVLGADAATGNENTAVLVNGVDLQQDRPISWASVNTYGRGHAVLIGAEVSDDYFVEQCPDNARWISNLIALLTERTRETADWTAPIQQQQKPVDIPNLHPSISAASGVHFANRHYDDAVFAALKAVEHRVRALTGSTDSGKTLMANVFNEKSATLDIAHDNADDRQKADEAEGFKFLFMGATQGLRNPRAHGAHLQTEEQEAMEMLAAASLLMRALDRAEKRMP